MIKLEIKKVETQQRLYEFIEADCGIIKVTVKEKTGQHNKLIEELKKGKKVEANCIIGYTTLIQVNGNYYVIAGETREANALIQKEV